MANKESYFASLHILMRAIPDGPEDAGRRLSRYWYRESRCQVRTGGQIQNPFNLRNPRLMNYLCAYKAPFCAFLWLKNPFNQRNQRLINYLYAFGIFTTVERALQINLFMQNKANFRKSQMNVTTFITKNYENETLSGHGKNKANTKPIQSQSKPIKANKMPKQTQNKPNTNPIKPNACPPSVWRVRGKKTRRKDEQAKR